MIRLPSGLFNCNSDESEGVSRTLMHTLCRALLCCILAWSFPAGSQCLAVEDTPSLKTIRAAVMPYLDFAPYFIAQEEGFFADQGLKVEFVQFKVSSHGLPALINGDIDVMAGLPFAGHFNAMAKGAPLKFVADRSHLEPGRCSALAIMARDGLVQSGVLDDPANWKGLRVSAANPSSPVLLLIERHLEPAGLGLDDLNMVYVPMASRLEGLINGSIDVGTINEPQATLLRRTGKVQTWRTGGKLYPNFQQGVIVFGPNLLEQDPQAGRNFMTAYLQGTQRYSEGKTDRNVGILQKHTDLDRNVLLEACWPATRIDGSIDVESVMDMQQWFIRKGMLDKALPVKTFWDSSFVEHARKTLDN